MGIINRLLLLPYALFTMALAVAVAAVALRIVPESIWLNELRYVLARQELLAVCGVFFLVSLKLFFAVFSRTSSSVRTHGEFMVVDTPAGALCSPCAALWSGWHSPCRGCVRQLS